jgi:hypothetical protein
MNCERCESDVPTLVDRINLMVCAACAAKFQSGTPAERALMRILRVLESESLNVHIVGCDSDVDVPTYERR